MDRTFVLAVRTCAWRRLSDQCLVADLTDFDRRPRVARWRGGATGPAASFSAPSPMRLLEQFVEKPRACAYLPGELASLEIQVLLEVTPEELDRMLERGWRRFGPLYFRPACADCNECVSLRIPTATFVPSKSQRRAMKASSGLRRVVGAPRVDEARLALYAKWHASREGARGWEPNAQTRERYALEFAFPHPSAQEAAFFDDSAGGKLVGVSLFDATPRALSAAFFFYDPEYAHMSLGSANVVSLVCDAGRQGRAHVYLGYRVLHCDSLRYKASFRPHELLLERPSTLDAAAPWLRAQADAASGARHDAP